MRVWRICRKAHAAAGLAGIGGLHVSGRWHHRGRPIVYASSTASLAALEVLVHVDPANAPSDLTLLAIDVPDDVAVETCDPTRLTPRWQAFPGPVELQDFGSTWLAEVRTAVLAVPSAVLPVERNLLLNPAHPHAARFRIVGEQPFSFDPRLLHL
jgi:RES domain-containing protein